MQNLLNITSEAVFLKAALETFHYQYENVTVYRKFVDYLGKPISAIRNLEDIPFLPIEIFKDHQVLAENYAAGMYFQSSGTTQTNRSKHYIADEDLYKSSILKSFLQFIGAPDDFVILGLLPNYSENKHSSLIYMVDFLMAESGHAENGYFLYNHQELFHLLQKLLQKDKKVLLFGVSFALLDFLDFLEHEHLFMKPSEQLTIIETGGMKGRKQEITKDELLKIFKNGFKTKQIFSEYSMTELLSQAYSLGDNLYQTPPWMRILIRNTEDPLRYLTHGKTGAINIIDLANRHSCSFIATQDLGKLEIINQTSYFSVLGRIDHSDIRGCSLLVS